ncbi:MAG: transcriptional regulator NrdR [Clostridiales bacterium]|nr:transcriptional regulator NrdR [Clostridiales bacterium]
MKCMFCGYSESKVIDSRATDEGGSIRRRRECMKCGRRFTTYEKIEHTPLLVIKNDKTRQPFDIAKIKNGVLKACEKRPVAAKDIDRLVSEIEKRIYNSYDQEIESAKIGEMVMDGLKSLDEVSYIRFASVYRQFKDVSTFIQFVSDFEKKIKE